jgi:hypothetical protein
MTVTALDLVLAAVLAARFAEFVCHSPEELRAILSGCYQA